MRLFWFVLLLSLGFSTACQDRTKTRRVVEQFAIVPGTPTVDTATPKVLTDDTRANTDFRVNTARQCDVYQQLSVRKVDILWVVDSSGSMALKQARLADNFNGFIGRLTSASPPIDFHIAVASTDTDDPAVAGILRPWAIGARSGNYISCVPQMAGGSLCNTGVDVATAQTSAVTAFNQMAKVGINGSAQERGLLAAYLALTNPDNISRGTTEKFIRSDAALYVVVVSDEDDGSCSPLTPQAVCTADPGCRCASDTTLSGANAWGSTAYFTRFLETYKGYGNSELVALAAIVAKDDGADAGVPSQFADAVVHSGCCNNPDGGSCPKSGINAFGSGLEVSYTGARYLKVAAETGGVAVSICDTNFGAALDALGYAASGLRREFRLTRGPELLPMSGVASGVELYVSPPTAATCMVDGNCPMGQFCRTGRCAKKLPLNLGSSTNGAQYVKCDGPALRNVVRFDGTAVPESLSAVEVCYDVQANFQNSCP